jgi:hypothetical protein
MQRTLNRRFEQRGTRFLIYPQSKKLRGFARPELIYVNAPPGSIRPGPEDDAMYVVDADEKLSYIEFGGKPPYLESRLPPAVPDPEGHFNHIRPTAPEFSSATVYASVKCVFEIWEDYVGRQLSWRNGRNRQRLEIIPRGDTDNSWAGVGFLEFGFADDAPSNPYCQNFDVVAHEVGHVIGWMIVGRPVRRTMKYRANDEACADLISIISTLHFDSVVNHLLEHTRGDLASPNLVSRIGELSKTRYTRNAFNSARMSTVKKVADPDEYKIRLARPFTGAGFDLLVGLYLEGLVERGAIPAKLLRPSRLRSREAALAHRVFVQHFKTKRARFESALFDARDYLGRLLARALERTPMRTRSHDTIAANMIAADRELSSSRYGALIRDCFVRREILPPAKPVRAR